MTAPQPPVEDVPEKDIGPVIKDPWEDEEQTDWPNSPALPTPQEEPTDG